MAHDSNTEDPDCLLSKQYMILFYFFLCHPLGQVYSLGRAEYGRLGLGQGAEEKSEPTPVMGMEPASGVACGASVSYAVTREGNRQTSRDFSDKAFINGGILCFTAPSDLTEPII